MFVADIMGLSVTTLTTTPMLPNSVK